LNISITNSFKLVIFKRVVI